MSSTQQALDYWREIDGNQKQTWVMVTESWPGLQRIFDKLEKRYIHDII